MSHMEDDEPPIKSHPASKEYRANYDTIDWGDDEPRVAAGGNTVVDGWDFDAINRAVKAGSIGTIVDGTFSPAPEWQQCNDANCVSLEHPEDLHYHLEREAKDVYECPILCEGRPGNDLDGEPYVVHDGIECKVNTYANYVQPVAYGVIEGVEPPAFSCGACSDTGNVGEDEYGLINCDECSIRGKQP